MSTTHNRLNSQTPKSSPQLPRHQFNIPKTLKTCSTSARIILNFVQDAIAIIGRSLHQGWLQVVAGLGKPVGFGGVGMMTLVFFSLEIAHAGLLRWRLRVRLGLGEGRGAEGERVEREDLDGLHGVVGLLGSLVGL